MISLVTAEFSAVLRRDQRPIISWDCLYMTKSDVQLPFYD